MLKTGPMEEVVQILIDEVLTLQAELVATRVVAFAALSGDPDGYMEAIATNADAFTLPLPMTEEQRDFVRMRLEDYRARWTAFQGVVYPGGWRGVRCAIARTWWRLKRVVVGVQPMARS